MLWADLSFEDKNKTILQLLIQISKSDLDLQTEEFSYLIFFCKNSGLDTDLIKNLQNI
jgi:hypothetical protein